MKAKVANLTRMYNEVKSATEQRNAALQTTLNVSEDFWTGLDDVKDKLHDVQDTLDMELKPALDADSIKRQQEELQVCVCSGHYLLDITLASGWPCCFLLKTQATVNLILHDADSLPARIIAFRRKYLQF